MIKSYILGGQAGMSLHELICLGGKAAHKKVVCGQLGLQAEQSGGYGVAREERRGPYVHVFMVSFA